MKRTPEPELMNDLEQAQAYAAADFEQAHENYVTLVQEHLGTFDAGCVALDLGCGPGDILLRLARRFKTLAVDGVDGADLMVKMANEALQKEKFDDRVRAHCALLPNDKPPRLQYDVVLSNSLLHHLHDPSVMWQSINAFAKKDARVFVMDLMRPDNEAQVDAFVEKYASGEPEVLQRDYRASLHAAFTPTEVRQQLASASLSDVEVKAVSDRHMIIWGKR